MSTLLLNTLTGKTSAGSIVVTGEGGSTTTNMQQGLCKGWALTDFAAAQNDDSFNVSAYTDYSAGYGQLTWNNAFNNANYAVAQACAGSDTNPNCVPGSNGNSSKSSSTIRINTMDTSNATPSSDMIDYAEFGTIAMGDLA
tara:strand:+ start:902 stop:1324 length:423 start_codon:yes stop_codon:yes gene_type:complete